MDRHELSDRDDLIQVGRVTGAHGIRGGLRVQSFVESMALFQIGEKILLGCPDGAARSMTVEWVKPHRSGLRLGLASVSDREQAQALIGSMLYVDKARLPTLEQDTYYWFQLEGLTVYDASGALIGRLERVIPTPANDIYLIRGEKAGRMQELLIPAIGSVVVRIDLGNKTMIVDPPQGV
ncbi:MAG: ribosome maturation factor RimM [Desulfosarcina sp.]